MTLKEYKECRKSLDVFKCSKCGFKYVVDRRHPCYEFEVAKYPPVCRYCKQPMKKHTWDDWMNEHKEDIYDT